MKFEIIPTLVVICLLPILLALGFWQLDRAEQKQSLLDLQKQNRRAEAISLSAATEDAIDVLKFKKIEATGNYDSAHQFLIDNQVRGGKAGYFVLTPFTLEGGSKAVLVNRGWVPMGQSRFRLPDVQIKETQSTITGRINSFPSVGIKLPDADKPSSGWPSLVQVVNSSILAKTLGYPLFQFMVELDKNSPEGYQREWQEPVVMPPAQHKAYAFQWFGLAFTLLMLFIWFNRLK